MSDQEKKIKVTDRRMFTPDGRLRQEYQDLHKDSGPSSSPAPEATRPSASEAPIAQAPEPPASTILAEPAAAEPRGPITAAPASQDAGASDEPVEDLGSGAAFQDLIGLLGQTASVYLRQSAQQLEQRAEHLEMARLHIDLLAILKQKTRGNLASEEQAMLDDALYQLRMAFVEVGG